MKYLTISSILIIYILIFAFSSYRAQTSSQPKYLPDTAPEIKSDKWLNTNEALSLQKLKGKVVLLDFWTYGCYNCKNTIPFLNSWYSKFDQNNFEIIGIHSPEFEKERNIDDVEKHVEELGIKYPVAIDNDYYNWYGYKVDAWPTLFIVDKKGEIRYSHIGEGSYKKTEEEIQKLLDEHN